MQKTLFLPLMLSLLLPAMPAVAAPQEAWRVTDAGARVSAAGILLPATAASLSLVKSGELSAGGKGIDNVAQYVSEDGAVQGTAYVYLTSYADAAVAAYMTDKAIIAHFGDATRRTSFAAVPVGGVANGAIRSFYDNAADGQLATVSALIHAGRWLVKLRVTGPSDRATDVAAGMDAMLAGMRFDQSAAVHPARAEEFGPCGKTRTGPAVGADFPRDGQDALCIDRTVQTADNAYETLRPVNAAGPVIVPLDDAGRTMRFVRDAKTADYQMTIHSVGRLDHYDSYTAIPAARVLATMIDGTDKRTAKPRSSTAYAANGVMTLMPTRGTD